jgi:3-hydroxyisobutyrate dehydrogenase/2-hydroxy-3-oxopropionate reductase
MAAVAVVGLGAMGSRIARRFLGAGHEVVVWNRDAAKAEALAAEGARVARTPDEATAGADAVVTMVADPEALREVTEGPDGVAAGVAAGTAVIQMSTVGPGSIERLTSVVPEAALLDAPVLGSISEVEAGTLRIFAGGSPALVERSTPLLSALGEVLHVGPLGAGSAAKLVANSTLFTALTALGEALALADALGLSRDAAFDVLAATPLAAQAERRRPAIESGRFEPRFTLPLARKDADLILDAAAKSQLDLRVVAAARAWLADAEQDRRADEDYAAVLEHIVRTVRH